MSASVRPSAGVMSRTAPAETMFQPGDRFLGFNIVRLLGAGGVAEVYEVLSGGRRYALKVLQRRFLVDQRQTRRATNEGQILAQIRHPNVINVHEVGFDRGTFWMRMELLDGLDLRDALTRMGAIPVGRAVSWLSQAAHGAHQCHMFGIVHRDIKPENIFLTSDDGVKLLDFGIAKLWGDLATLETATGGEQMPIGTAPYMAPEQVKSERRITPAADVYALGMTLWEMIAGYHPLLKGRTRFDIWEIYRQQLFEDIPPLTELGIPAPLSAVVARALSKRWQDRQPNGLTLADELGEAWRRCAAVFEERTADAGRTTSSRLTQRMVRPDRPADSAMGASAPVRFHTHEILPEGRDSGVLDAPIYRDTDVSPPPSFGDFDAGAQPSQPRDVRELMMPRDVLDTPPGTVMPIRRPPEVPRGDSPRSRTNAAGSVRPAPVAPPRRLGRGRAYAIGALAFGVYVILALEVKALIGGRAAAPPAPAAPVSVEPPRAAAAAPPAAIAPPAASAETPAEAPALPGNTASPAKASLVAPKSPPPKRPVSVAKPREATASRAPESPPAQAPPKRQQPFTPRMFGTED